jgi:hypothetical protein
VEVVVRLARLLLVANHHVPRSPAHSVPEKNPAEAETAEWFLSDLAEWFLSDLAEWFLPARADLFVPNRVDRSLRVPYREPQENPEE